MNAIFNKSREDEGSTFWFTVRLKKLSPSFQYITMTANAMKSDKDKCIDAGMNHFISKPVDPRDINQILYNFLNT